MSGEPQTTFGELLRHARWQSNFTQEELAERAGISTRAVSDLERGRNRSPRRDTLDMLASALDLSGEERARWERARRRLSVRHSASKSHKDTSVRQGNLPAPFTAFVGRSADVEAILGLLEQGTVRLMTLTGPGGVGKTRLAVTVASTLQAAYPDGVWFVDLERLDSPDLVIPTIATTLNVTVREGRDPVRSLIEVLQHRQMLLLIDNMEHVVSSAVQVGEIIRACPHLLVIVTSRVPLHVQGEREYPVVPLTLPEAEEAAGVDIVMQSESGRLFVDRAQAVRPEFRVTEANAEVIAEICRHLDGVPLAIELASVHVRTLSPQAILHRLTHPLPFLTGGNIDLPPRQQTLRNTISWSYELLSERCRWLFRHLSVFQGGWTLATGVELASEDERELLGLLEQLVEHNLVRVEEQADGEPRFSMLDTIREFGLEQLDANDELCAARHRHAMIMLAMTHRAHDAADTPEHSAWLDRLEAERANLSAALLYTSEFGGDLPLDLATHLYGFWYIRGPMREGSMWLERALAGDTASPQVVRARALYQLGEFTRVRGAYTHATDLAQESLNHSQEAGDEAGVALALFLLGNIASSQVRYRLAMRRFEHSLEIYRRLGDVERMAFVTNNLAQVYLRQGESDRAKPMFEEALTLWQTVGSSWGAMIAFVGLGEIAREQGDYPRARALYLESLQLFHSFDDRWGMCECLYDLAEVLLRLGETQVSTCLYSSADRLRVTVGIVAASDQEMRQRKGIEEAQAALGPEEFSRIWDECQNLDIDDLIDSLL